MELMTQASLLNNFWDKYPMGEIHKYVFVAGLSFW